MKKEGVFLLIAFVLFAGLMSAIPQTINLQGKLTDSAGIVISGNYNINFTIYNASSGGTLLWTENYSVTTDANGIYSVILDGVSLNFSEQYYLGIAVANDAEMIPRINLTSSPYTFRTNVSDYLDATRNYTISERLSFKFGEFIDNIAGFLRIAGGFNVVNFSDTSQSFFFVNNASGNVGIGTASPTAKLDINGSINVSGNMNISGIYLGNILLSDWASLNETLRVDSVNSSFLLENTTLWNRANSINSSFLLENTTLFNRINSVNASLLLANITLSSINATANIGNLFNATSLIFAQMNNNTATIGQLFNATALIYAQSVNTTAVVQMLLNGTTLNLKSLGINASTPAYTLETYGGIMGRAVNLSNVLYINSTSGNIGIGTISPGAKLEVAGNVIFDI